jgi:hypothetical protein
MSGFNTKDTKDTKDHNGEVNVGHRFSSAVHVRSVRLQPDFSRTVRTLEQELRSSGAQEFR